MVVAMVVIWHEGLCGRDCGVAVAMVAMVGIWGRICMNGIIKGSSADYGL